VLRPQRRPYVEDYTACDPYEILLLKEWDTSMEAADRYGRYVDMDMPLEDEGR